MDATTLCSVSRFGDTRDRHIWRDEHWASFYTAAPERRRQLVSRSSVAKRADARNDTKGCDPLVDPLYGKRGWALSLDNPADLDSVRFTASP